ncbi:CRISPR-associated protein Cmr2 [Caminicella sporogenes DSM 14501]|uniref:CRISPR-associated protein Cmr2 n=1 Tax=Caminicella sporogenes DSM 14501 TaxID=1121266 RepID=A0A1M6LSY5_9FIRM|nr:type III-B CRISPR-associated protein Cas10/Cmr2 [Caminicella sporogenes]RKD27941.1 type III-B CRISPR-associated protein Cas10/Cmr2 [Caminicella sporogenes]SHJ74331.1 CRISPR-associated protein Cmr2 [Caminicella sporogenes DSM 14501]
MSRLLLFSMASVQEYIMESKKVIDLTNSSYIVSIIMNEVKKAVIEELNGNVILPNSEVSEKVKTSNQLLITYESKDSMAEKLEKRAKAKFRYIIKQLNDLKNLKDKEINAVIEDIIKIYWAEVEFEDEYEKAYKKVHKILEAVKHTRVFKNEQDENLIKGPKCSICGKRNVRYILSKKNINGIESNKLKEKDYLCLACYIKRTLKEDKNEKQNSTAKIALGRWIKENIENNKCIYEKLEKKAEEISKSSKYGKYQLLYKENMLKEIKEEEMNEVLNYYEELTKTQEKYYCIYRFDIDNLGKWMNGKYKDSKENLKDYQQELSNKINEFFEKVLKFFDENENNTLVYAGGDDLLALLNVKDAFKFSKEIEEEFNKILKKNNNKFKKLTFSQGIFIIHYKDTLKESLKVSKERLEWIKEKFGNSNTEQKKDGLIVAVLTDGYYYKEFYFKNHMNDEYIIKTLENIFNYFYEDKFSFFHNELAKMFMRLDESDELEEERIIRDMLFVQQKRLIGRSNKRERDKTKEDEKALKNLLEDILYQNPNCVGISVLENYFNMFYIMEKLYIILREDEKDEGIKNKA